jgi:hypothetical protein
MKVNLMMEKLKEKELSKLLIIFIKAVSKMA